MAVREKERDQLRRKPPANSLRSHVLLGSGSGVGHQDVTVRMVGAGGMKADLQKFGGVVMRDEEGEFRLFFARGRRESGPTMLHYFAQPQRAAHPARLRRRNYPRGHRRNVQRLRSPSKLSTIAA